VKCIMVLVILLALGLTGCQKKGTEVSVEGAKDNFEVTLLFTKDGCKVYRFYDYRTHYFTNCTETVSTQKTTSGKTTTYWEENIGGKHDGN
jgi:hypothetical protein